MLNMYALKSLPASTIGAFIYLQPPIAIIYAIVTGNDSLDLIKVIAMVLVFSGVYFATTKLKKTS
jgi:drug/metabolite transporter (DMT)-like permease